IQENIANITLTDLHGRQLTIPVTKHGDIYRANIEDLAPGLYMLRVSGQNLPILRRLVKR
ncbi:MAG: T9SS type A sorting domain-containing protein, partial [Cytophagales bacterium]